MTQKTRLKWEFAITLCWIGGWLIFVLMLGGCVHRPKTLYQPQAAADYAFWSTPDGIIIIIRNSDTATTLEKAIQEQCTDRPCTVERLGEMYLLEKLK